MPDDIYVIGFDLPPPAFEIFFRNIERRRCDEMIEYDVVLLAPAEGSDVVEIIVIEKLARDRFRRNVGGAIDELRSQEEGQRRQLR